MSGDTPGVGSIAPGSLMARFAGGLALFAGLLLGVVALGLACLPRDMRADGPALVIPGTGGHALSTVALPVIGIVAGLFGTVGCLILVLGGGPLLRSAVRMRSIRPGRQARALAIFVVGSVALVFVLLRR